MSRLGSSDTGEGWGCMVSTTAERCALCPALRTGPNIALHVDGGSSPINRLLIVGRLFVDRPSC